MIHNFWSAVAWFIWIFSRRWGEAEVNFRIALDRDELYFGDSLKINLGIIPGEYMERIAFDIRFPEGVEFQAVIASEFCDGKQECLLSYRNISWQEASRVPKWSFDNQLFYNCTQLTIIEREKDPWLKGYKHKTDILLLDLATTKVHAEEFVISFLRYWNKTTTTNRKIDEIATQKYRRRGFRLIPVRLNLKIDGDSVDDETIRKIFIDSEIEIAAHIALDWRGAPVKILVMLPKVKGSNSPAVHVSSARISYTPDSGEIDSSPTELSLQASDSEYSLLLTAESIKKLGCQSKCNVSVFLDVTPISKTMRVGDEFSLGAVALYGENFALNHTATPGKIKLIGPDLSLVLLPSSTESSEAGSHLSFSAFLNHSAESTETLVIHEVNFHFRS